MKGKMLIVLFSLALAFGMLAASCDNGLLPAKPEVQTVLTDYPDEVATPGLPAGEEVLVDFKTNDGTKPYSEWAFPGDSKPDVENGKLVKMARTAAQDLIDGNGDHDDYLDPADGTLKTVTYSWGSDVTFDGETYKLITRNHA